MKVEHVSYDVITPSAARGVLEAIHWKPQMVWRIQCLHVLNPIRFESIRRNEVGSKISAAKAASAMRVGSTEGLVLHVDEDRQQGASTLLKDVAYVIEAAIELTAKGRADPAKNVQKHLEIARRRAAKGQYFNPYRGIRYPAEVIQGAVWPYHGFSLSLRDVEMILAGRGIVVSYDTIREWGLRFGRLFVTALKRGSPSSGDKWFLD
jgi:CRISPR-associated protein Cas5 subtype I-C